MAHAHAALREALSMPELDVFGLHVHIGSQITETAPYEDTVAVVLRFSAEAKDAGLRLRELSFGGGFPVRYTMDHPVPPVADFARTITSALQRSCEEMGLPLPRLVIEPGRSLVARAGVALYTVGVIKEVPGVRTFASVDGGMADCIQPALYQLRLEAVVANRMASANDSLYTIAGKFCESGDVLIRDIKMPALVAGDLLAVPGSGAYSIPQSCNYNAFCRPPVVMLKGGVARLIRRGETMDDLLGYDVD
jgi:diaminopimelate decarboxylase